MEDNLIDLIKNTTGDTVVEIAEKLGVSRQAIYGYIADLYGSPEWRIVQIRRLYGLAHNRARGLSDKQILDTLEMKYPASRMKELTEKRAANTQNKSVKRKAAHARAKLR